MQGDGESEGEAPTYITKVVGTNDERVTDNDFEINHFRVKDETPNSVSKGMPGLPDWLRDGSPIYASPLAAIVKVNAIGSQS